MIGQPSARPPSRARPLAAATSPCSPSRPGALRGAWAIPRGEAQRRAPAARRGDVVRRWSPSPQRRSHPLRMSLTTRVKIFCLFCFALALAVAAVNTGASARQPTLPAATPAQKIDAQVLADTANGQSASFVALLSDQANLRAAYTIDRFRRARLVRLQHLADTGRPDPDGSARPAERPWRALPELLGREHAGGDRRPHLR